MGNIIVCIRIGFVDLSSFRRNFRLSFVNLSLLGVSRLLQSPLLPFQENHAWLDQCGLMFCPTGKAAKFVTNWKAETTHCLVSFSEAGMLSNS